MFHRQNGATVVGGLSTVVQNGDVSGNRIHHYQAFIAEFC